MIKSISFFGTILLLFVLASFIHSGQVRTMSPKTPEPVACVAATATVSGAEYFRTRGIPEAVMIRKNIYTLTASQIGSIKTGIAAMKSLPVTNQTSWLYQAAIHQTTLTQNLPSWNSCKHGSPFFLSWHRMYLYFFERILRAKSGDPTLTLPYWDYQSNPVMPPAYRDATPGNTLYDGSRFGSINGGGSLPSGIMTDFMNILNTDIPYYTFSSDLEGPHGSVHTSIGGNMFHVNRAALDPVFWLHHANIDRLWEKWLRLCGGRSNPTDAAYLNQQFTFFDENGTAVVMTGKDIISTVTKLNYRYDFTGKIPPCLVTIFWPNWKWRQIRIVHWPDPVVIHDTIRRLAVGRANLDELKGFTSTQANQKFFSSGSGFTDQIYLEIENMKIEKAPEGVIEVYLNLPAGQSPNPNSKSFAGLLNLFGMEMTGHNVDHPMVSKVNLTQTVHVLGLQPEDFERANLSFFTRGITMNGKMLKTKTAVQISGLSLVVQKAQR